LAIITAGNEGNDFHLSHDLNAKIKATGTAT
jgi:hypothetical protein